MTGTNWLVSSAGRRGHLISILRQVAELSGHGSVNAVDASPLSAAGLLADKFEVVPRADDPAFVDHVLDVCDRYSIRHIIPTIDPELPVYASARSRFEERGRQVWVSSPDVVTLGRDKWLFHKWLAQHGFLSPTTAEVRSLSAPAFAGPVVAKPRGGSASIGLFRGRIVGELALDELTDDYIVQTLMPGYEVTIDFAVDRSGHLLGISARRRLEVRAGEVSKAVTIEHKLVRSEVERFASLLPGAFGVLNVQVLVDDAAGTVCFLELNPRFGGGYPLSWEAGARFPLALANPDGDPAVTDGRPGLVMLRYDQAVFEEASFFGDELL
jgi:carbamoyl-phosphate synthase large subunit